jgi:hypothetical protein
MSVYKQQHVANFGDDMHAELIIFAMDLAIANRTLRKIFSLIDETRRYLLPPYSASKKINVF